MIAMLSKSESHSLQIVHDFYYMNIVDMFPQTDKFGGAWLLEG